MPTAAFVRLARCGPIMRHRISPYRRGSICWAPALAAVTTAATPRIRRRRNGFTTEPRCAGEMAGKVQTSLPTRRGIYDRARSGTAENTDPAADAAADSTTGAG